MNLQKVVTTTFEGLNNQKAIKYTTLREIASAAKNAIVDGPFGSSLKTSDYVDDGIPVLQGKNITGDKFKFFDARFITHNKAHELARSKAVVGDILLIKIGSIGYAAEITNLGDYPYAIIPANLVKLTLDETKADKNYILHWLRTESVKRYFQSIASKTAQPALSLGKIKELPIFLPPLAEQQRIAAILDKAEEIKRKREQAIAKLDELAQSTFEEMFGNTITNTKGWNETTLADIVVGKPNNGIFRKNDEYGDGLPVAWVEELFRGEHLNLNNSRKVKATKAEIEKYGLQYGDLLFCRSSLKLDGIGYNSVYLGENNTALFECHLIRVKPNFEKIDTIFANYMLRTPASRENIKKNAKTVTMTTIDQDGLLRTKIFLPPMHLQNKFNSIFTSIVKQKTVLAKGMRNDAALASSLQHQAFTTGFRA